MKNILIHGLGQNHKSWNETIKFLEIDNIDVLCPALFKMSSGNITLLLVFNPSNNSIVSSS